MQLFEMEELRASTVLRGVTECLAECVPELERHLSTLFFSLPPEIGLSVAQTALPLLEFDQLTSGVEFDFLPSSLSRAARKRQLTYIAGRLCAEEALRIATGLRKQVGRHASGCPVWPQGIVGSISHTSRIACAVATRREGQFGVGIDVEEIVSDSQYDAIVQLCLCGNEPTRFLGLENRNLMATIVFSAKEALYKSIYPVVQQWVDFDELEVTSIDLDDGSFVLESSSAYLDAAQLSPTNGRFAVREQSVYCFVAPQSST